MVEGDGPGSGGDVDRSGLTMHTTGTGAERHDGIMTRSEAYDGSLTGWERAGLSRQLNLADGHARYDFTPLQRDAISRSPELLRCSARGEQELWEHRFVTEFFRLSGQSSHSAVDPSPLLNYSSSSAIDVTAKVLSARRIVRAALVEPTFDNIPALLRRSGIVPSPICLNRLATDDEYLARVTSEFPVLFLVLPNNPTGDALSFERFRDVVQACASTGCILVLDLSFRFFSTLIHWDQYAVISEYGTTALILEDTGKTWPPADLKIGLLSATSSLRELAVEATEELLLNVPPFTLQILCAFMEKEPGPSEGVAATGIARRNRDYLAASLAHSDGSLFLTDANTSVAWLKTPTNWNSDNFVRYCLENGLSLLPGSQFYWANPATAGHSSVLRSCAMRTSSLRG
ncbi:MAG: aminotransferase class I/II-fold pyridoxal phosphate-dependent enzyme [Kineosporiaceae bacterium]